MTRPHVQSQSDSAASGSPRQNFPPAVRSLLSKRSVIGAAIVAIALLCLYRIARFVPQPLDGPHTLRPILNGLLVGFQRLYATPEKAYEDWRAFCLLALLIPSALAVLNFAREHGLCRLPDRVTKILCSRILLFFSIAALLLLCRFPSLVDYQLNPDEGQFLSSAHKLFYDPSFFHAVDCITSGPLNIYPLMLPAVFGVSPDFASSRILVLIVAFCIIYFLYLSVRLLAPDSVARIAILPIAGSLAVFEHTNLIHYSSEQIPILFICISLYLATRILRNPASHAAIIFFLGLLTSATFFAKLQGVPIVASMALVSIAYVHATHNAARFWRPSLLYVAGIVVVQLLNAIECLIDGVWTNFWMSYIVANQRYADVGTNFVTELPSLLSHLMETPEVGLFLILFLGIGLAFAVRRLRTIPSGGSNGLLPLAGVIAVTVALAMLFLMHVDAWSIFSYITLLAIFLLPLSLLLLFETGYFGTDPVRWFGLLSGVTTAAAVFSVYRPHRLFPHYMFFLFPPFAAVIAWMLMREQDGAHTIERVETRHHVPAGSRFVFPLIVVAFALTNAAYLWGTRDPHAFRTIVATIRAPEGDLVRSLTSPAGQIFVWGWASDPYLSSGRVSPAREYNLFYIFNGPQDVRDYYRARLLRDLSQNPPELFIDAMGAASWAYGDRGAFNFEQFPDIEQFVTSFYIHVGDAYDERFFLRRDLAPRTASFKFPAQCSPAAIRCVPSPRRVYIEAAKTLVIDDQAPLQLPGHALIETRFTPEGRQTENATILNNEAVPNSFRGFRFQNSGGDNYRLLLGLGNRWILSKEVLLPPAKPVDLVIEFNGNDVQIRANNTPVDDLHLPAPFANAPGPVNVGSWIAGQCRFTGTIDFFQIVDLDKK